MAIVLRILQYIFNLLQEKFNVGHPSEQFCILRCVDVLSPAMIIQRPRSVLEVALKVLCLSVMVTHIVGLVYDFSRQTDIRLTIDILSMIAMFVSMIVRSTCVWLQRSHVSALELLDKNPTFRVGTPYADMSRKKTASLNNRYLGALIAGHWFAVTVYVIQNVVLKEPFVKIITFVPIDLSNAPTLEKLAQLCYGLVGYAWGLEHESAQLTIIVLIRFAITEFRVFLYSLATLDDQIYTRSLAYSDHSKERILRDLLHEHARQHSQLLKVVMHLRMLLRTYALVHYFFYMIIVATSMSRSFIIPGSSSLGVFAPLAATSIFFFETFVLCMLVEKLVQLNRKVSTKLYGFNWPQYLQYGRSIKRTMLLMMMQANMTKDFSAGGLTTVSAEVFATTCRMIYTLMMAMANLATEIV